MPDVDAVGGIALRDGALLLIKRGHEPSAGLWSLPGGRVEPGETPQAAVAREMLEETGLVVDVGEFVGEIRVAGRDPAAATYRIRDYRVTPVGGDLRAGDDAADAAWVPIDTLRTDQQTEYALSAGLIDTLTKWGVW